MDNEQRRLGEDDYREPTTEDSIEARKQEAVRQTAEAAISALSQEDLEWADAADTPQNATKQVISALFDQGRISQIEGMRQEDPVRLQLLTVNRRGEIIDNLHRNGLTDDAFRREVNAINFLEQVLAELERIMTDRLAEAKGDLSDPREGSIRNALRAALDQ